MKTTELLLDLCERITTRLRLIRLTFAILALKRRLNLRYHR